MRQNNNMNQSPPEVAPIRMKSVGKSKFLTFVFALLPGVGQMYQGLMKKGISLMLLFFGIIALSVALYFPSIMLVMPVVWFYAFFDTISRMNYSLDELAAVEDEFMPNLKIERNGKINELLRNRHIFIGWTVIILGAYALFVNVLNSSLMRMFDIRYEVLDFIRRTIPSVIIPIICIIIGVNLIKGSNKKTEVKLIKKGNKND